MREEKRQISSKATDYKVSVCVSNVQLYAIESLVTSKNVVAVFKIAK